MAALEVLSASACVAEDEIEAFRSFLGRDEGI